jgi:hypothetical protein
MLTRDQAVTVMVLCLTGLDAVARARRPATGEPR